MYILKWLRNAKTQTLLCGTCQRLCCSAILDDWSALSGGLHHVSSHVRRHEASLSLNVNTIAQLQASSRIASPLTDRRPRGVSLPPPPPFDWLLLFN